MPRPIIGNRLNTPTNIASPTPLTTTRGALQGPRLQQRLRQTRSRNYVEQMTRLDAGTHCANRSAFETLIEAISNEFPELGIEQRPIGIVTQCYLGAPYEVHICDLGGHIIEHFETFRSMPPLYERARALALHPSYLFIEIYPDTLRAISIDGSVSVIEK